MSSGLKMTFLIHFIVALIFAIGFLFFPAMVLGWWGFTSTGPAVLSRIMGAYVLAISVSSWLGYRASEAQQVRIVVAMEVWLTIIGAFVSLYGIIFEGAPALMWVNVVIFAVFAVLWIAFYPRTKSA
jgi:hypothetical protein